MDNELPSEKKCSGRSSAGFWFMIAAAVLVFYALRYVSPYIVTRLYHSEAFSVLNSLAGSFQRQPLDFYLGMIEDRVTGPLAMMTAAGVLMALLLRYGVKAGFGRFALGIFFFLISTRAEVLFYPPYGEHLGCSLTEAVWLLRNNFDYVKLFHSPSYIVGGPKYYLFSLFPGYVAFLMKISPDPRIFLFLVHGTFFAMAAVIVSLLREIARKVFSEDMAVLTAALLVFMPLFQGLTETVNMEVPVLFFMMWAVFYLTQKKFFHAALFVVLSLMMKGSGTIVCAAFFTAAGLMVCSDFPARDWDASKKRRYALIMALASVLMILGMLVVKLRSWFVETASFLNNTVKLFAGLRNFHEIEGFIFIAALTLLVLFGLFLRQREREGRGFFPALKIFMREYYSVCVMAVVMLMWFALQMNFSNLTPRYIFVLLPFVVFCGVFSMRQILVSLPAARAVLMAAVFFAAFCSYGFPNAPRPRTYAVYNELEKSLAYRNDLRLHMKIARQLEEHARGLTIGAPYPTGHTLAFPEFGFVREPFDVIMYLVDVEMGSIRRFQGLSTVDQARTVWLMFDDTLPGCAPSIMEPDRVLGAVMQGNKRAFLIRGGHGVQKAYEIKVRAALMHSN